MKKIINRRNGIFAILVASSMTVTYSEAQNPFMSEDQNPQQTVPYIQNKSTIDCYHAFALGGQGYAVCAREVTSCPVGWVPGCPCKTNKIVCALP